MWTSKAKLTGTYKHKSTYKQHIVTMNQSRYARSIVPYYLDGTSMKIVNSRNNTILPIDFVLTI
jgi:hypothetical protein